MKNSPYLLYIILFWTSNVQAQQSLVCGTEPSVQEIIWMQNAQRQFVDIEQNFLINRNNPTQYLPVRIHIVQETNGTGGLSMANFQEAFDTLNSFYSLANIEFFVCGSINYINDSGNYNFNQADDNAFTSLHNAPNLINIYFFNSITSTSGGGLCGYASFPGGNDRMMMTNSCAMNGSTLAHEMGHFLGLYHTHGKSNTGTTNELVNGSNCAYEGDDICDTDADPNLSGNVDMNCNYTGTAQDLNGQFYSPDPFNVMSYSRKFCRIHFSPMQYARAYMVATAVRNYFVCPSISADFAADVRYTCSNNLTVNFSDSSIGATTWEWDIDSDGNVDYTTQNITHNYTSPGDYTVYLKVTGAGGISSKTKVEHIQVGHSYNMPFLENFESFVENNSAIGLKNGWRTSPNETADGFRWTPSVATTPSASTGPSVDNTLGTPLGHYMYTEATGSSNGDSAVLITPCISITGTQPTLEFYSHQYGSNTGSIHVDVFDGTVWTNDITLPLSGQSQANSASPYDLNTVDLTAFLNQNIQIRFRAFRSNGYRGDMAIDDVRVYDILATKLQEPEAIYHLSVAPNPSKDIFTIQMHSKKDEKARMLVYDQIGTLILERPIAVQTGANSWQLDLAMLPEGAYILNLQTATQTFAQRLLRL